MVSARILPFPDRITKASVDGGLGADDQAAICYALRALEAACDDAAHPVTEHISRFAHDCREQIAGLG